MSVSDDILKEIEKILSTPSKAREQLVKLFRHHTDKSSIPDLTFECKGRQIPTALGHHLGRAMGELKLEQIGQAVLFETMTATFTVTANMQTLPFPTPTGIHIINITGELGANHEQGRDR